MPAPPALTPGEQRLQDGYNALHAARSSSQLVAALYGEAMGEGYPGEVAASSSCDWPLLGLLVARLRMRPGQLLVDAGCGTGGVGLWLARALAARLVGIDISSTAVDRAAARADAFVLPGQARFAVGTLEATGLPDGAAHGIICVDAFSWATDQAAALREMRRILCPGGRAVLTRSHRPDTSAPWAGQAKHAGLVVEHVDERPDEPAMWERLYGLWIAHEPQLRRELGDAQAQNMLAEAERTLPTLAGRRAVLVTLQRPRACGLSGPCARSGSVGCSLHDRQPGRAAADERHLDG